MTILCKLYFILSFCQSISYQSIIIDTALPFYNLNILLGFNDSVCGGMMISHISTENRVHVDLWLGRANDILIGRTWREIGFRHLLSTIVDRQTEQ